MSKIHYATGGLITPEKAEFETLCGRKFPRGGSDIMQSGYAGALNVTCEDCRWILDITAPKKERVWYEVTDGNAFNEFFTQQEAESYLRDMRRGFPKKHPTMSEENRRYHRKAGKRNYVVKVVQTTTYVSH